MKFYIVDAFAKEMFGGNPAGVVLLNKDFPQEAFMIKVASELRYSETVFIKQIEKDRFHMRYFTPTAEVDLCGHATIGAFYALMNEGLVKANESYKNNTLAGELEIKVMEDKVFMEMGQAQKLGTLTPEDKEELYKIMGISCQNQDIHFNGQKICLEPQIVTTGLPDIIMPVGSEEELEKIDPDMKALASFSQKLNVVGVHSFTVSRDKDFQCRNFAPLYGIDEEAATGTASGALTYFLYQEGLISADNDNLFIQGEKMGRPSRIVSNLQEVGGRIKIQVGGQAVIVAEGVLKDE